MSKKTSIMSAVFLFSIAITLIDAFVHPNYFVKIPIKILFFLALPLLFFVKNKDVFKDFKDMFVFRKDGILKALLLGIGVYAVIVGGYFITRNIIDFSNVSSSLTEGMGITAKNFIYVSLYISLMIAHDPLSCNPFFRIRQNFRLTTAVYGAILTMETE